MEDSTSSLRTEATMPRMKQVYDGAIPSGNSVALLNLVRLSRLTMDLEYEEIARKLTKAFSQEIQGAPDGYTFLLLAVDFLVGPSHSLMVVGNPKESDTQDMFAAARKEYMPSLVFALREPGLSGLGYEKLEGKATAYVCKDQMCLRPATTSKLCFNSSGQPDKSLNLINRDGNHEKSLYIRTYSRHGERAGLPRSHHKDLHPPWNGSH